MEGALGEKLALASSNLPLCIILQHSQHALVCVLQTEPAGPALCSELKQAAAVASCSTNRC